MKVLITGGAGFIGCNITKRLMDEGNEVIVFDNLCRKGSELNLEWLRLQGDLAFIKGDLRNYSDINNILNEHKKIDLVLHLAAQVAVTSSVTNPREDFEINALGTLNLLEAIRNSQVDPVLLYTSTNKVYGKMEDVQVRLNGERYEFEDFPQGIDENRPLDFHSPYGCSKGCAEQYVRDYSRIYGLRSLVFRMSCIYGVRQFGVEDQGWVAWFTIASVLGLPITIYGDGKQVRDILYIGDLAEAILKAVERIDATKGNIYNIGGGFQNGLSLLELVHYLEELGSLRPDELLERISFSEWRPGDQPVFICDISKAKKDFAWEPRWRTKEGIRQLYEWIIENKNFIKEVMG